MILMSFPEPGPEDCDGETSASDSGITIFDDSDSGYPPSETTAEDENR